MRKHGLIVRAALVVALGTFGLLGTPERAAARDECSFCGETQWCEFLPEVCEWNCGSEYHICLCIGGGGGCSEWAETYGLIVCKTDCDW